MIIKLTDNQAEVISKAMELYARLMMGQFYEIYSLPYTGKQNVDHVDKIVSEKRIKTLIYPELQPFGYYSIFAEVLDESARIAWDIMRVIRHNIAWRKQPEGGTTVDFDEPYPSTSVEKLPLILREEE